MNDLKETICNFLPQRQRSKGNICWVHTYVNILVVDIGFKPAWLCDFAFYEDQKVGALLDGLARLGVIHRERIVVLEADGRFLIGNKVLLVQMIGSLCASDERTGAVNSFVVIEDFSKSSPDKPFRLLPDGDRLSLSSDVHEKLVRNLSPILALLFAATCGPVHLKFIDQNFLPTFIGISLGYPVVYIYEGEADVDLGMVDVTVHAVSLFIPSRGIPHSDEFLEGSVTVYSFSCPLHSEACSKPVARWREETVKKSAALELAIDLRQEDKFSVNLVI